MILKITLSVLVALVCVASVSEVRSRFPYNFIRNPSCQKSGKNNTTRLTIVVKVRPASATRRMVIRNTWGSEHQYEWNITIRTIFHIGLPGDSLELDTESQIFGDILQSSFQDTYYNLTIKTVMGVRWAVENCNSTDFIVYIDDDYVLLVNNLVEFIKDHHFERNDVLYMGQLRDKVAPVREEHSKWYISTNEYNRTMYPPFVNGAVIIYSFEGLKAVYKGIESAPFIKLEDIFIGLAAEKVNITPVNIDKITSTLISTFLKENNFRDRVAIRGFESDESIDMFWHVSMGFYGH